MLSEISKIIEAFQELQRLHQLNLELLEQLNVACGYFVDNSIPLPNVEILHSLFAKSKALLTEIESSEPKILQYQKIADEKKHLNRTDEDVPVPFQPLYKGAIVCAEHNRPQLKLEF